VDIGLRSCSGPPRRHPLSFGRLLPRRSWIRPGLLIHVHLHALAQRRYADRPVGTGAKARPIGRGAAAGLVQSLRGTVEGLDWNPAGTVWADYTAEHNYSEAAVASKRELVGRLLGAVGPKVVWDLGANTGEYSRVAREAGASVIAFDIDPGAVERHYRAVRGSGEQGILPLLLDLANPSPALGWAHRERRSLEERGPADALLALALVHHLAIGRNVLLDRIAEFLARLGRALVVEFVPKSDSRSSACCGTGGRLLDYDRAGFEAAFGRHFRIDSAHPVTGPSEDLRDEITD
jgi:hypothetical protein